MKKDVKNVFKQNIKKKVKLKFLFRYKNYGPLKNKTKKKPKIKHNKDQSQCKVRSVAKQRVINVLILILCSDLNAYIIRI